ncbi:MAG: protein-disulfide reductase DsbD family protein [Phycisphaerae bacterium]
MRTRTLIATTFLATLLPTAAAPATAEAETGVTARLLAGTTAVAPGESFLLGVHLTMKKGWHVYWKNPGEAGLATRVEWNLPHGFKAGPLRWPVPIRFTMPGRITAFGYAGEVVLMALIRVPNDLGGRRQVTLKAKVSWLRCNGTCVPGEATVRLSLPVARKAEPARQDLFRRWRARLPVDAASPRSPARVRVTGGDAFPPEGAWTVRLAWSQAVRDVEWFPAPGPALAVSDVDVQTEAGKRRTEITFTARRLKGYDLDRQALEAVVAYTNAKGERRGVRLDMPLTAVKKAKPADP